jgi:hypothetical protein
MPHNPPVNPTDFAESVRSLLNEDWRRYRNFGAYWYFVKALLKRFYDRHEMPILGDYEDKSVNDRVPAAVRDSLGDMVAAAIDEYQENASFRLGGNRMVDDDGEEFTLLDTDVEG